MENHKIIELYNSLSLRERIRLNKFIISPYYNESLIIIRIHEFIMNSIEKEEVLEINNKQLFTYVYGKKKFNIGLLRYFFTRLNDLIQQFIGVEFDRSNNHLNVQINFFKERQLDKFYQSKIKKLEEVLSDKQILNVWEYANYSESIDLIDKYYYQSINIYVKYIKEKSDYLDEKLDDYFILYKIQRVCEALNLLMISGVKKNIFLQDIIIESIENKEHYKKNVLISLYYSIYKSFKEGEIDIARLITTIKKNIKNIDHENLKSIISYAQNFCLRQINKGKIELQETLLEIYKLSLETLVIAENNQISESNFKNIVFLSLRLKEFNWALSFMKKYIDFIPKEKRENAINFNMARYYFFQKQYDKAMLSLRQVELNDLFYGIDARSLLLKTYYETSEREAFYNLLSSFRAFIKRKKLVSSQHQKSYSNLMKYAKKVMLISFKNKNKLMLLNNEIQSLNPCADKGWLIEKINEKNNYYKN